MPQDVRGDRPVDVGAVGDALHELLNSPLADSQRVVNRKVAFEQGLHPGGEGNYAAFGRAPIGAPFAIDHQAVGLPVNVIFREAGQLCDAQARNQERPDHELFHVCLARIGQAGGFVLG